ncbi:carboxylate--amine ligase [Halolamina sp. CBA1230]|uniref:carboxylate--amine ligase n=1 Tax=Halolamina sp. CBA1230 TaxID=1853690 RepID=UPI0009A1CA84|nr:carboxylate--amine ligase [Halolamina sp. CBA1230]QKY20116.1 carboxylate--amine ligase [Halolamina sp. CBA1230]
MAEQFLDTDALVDAVADAEFDRTPAVVANAHITGLSVARALDAHGVPVIAIDQVGNGVAYPSDAIDFAGQVRYPLDDPEGFSADLAAIADAAGEVVAFGCMDEWVHGFADAGVENVHLPWENHVSVLDKTRLYKRAEELDVPYPETYFPSETDLDTAAEALGFPLVVKPARKREGEEAIGSNVVEVATGEELHDVLDAADAAGVEVMLQEKVNIATGKDRSLASYVPAEGEPLAVVGNAAVRFPLEFGTSCLVETVDASEIEARALSVIEDAGYHGISESEFVYDQDREEYVLLDINTRPWKWISLPVSLGANLPYAAYADVVGAEFDPGEIDDGRWVYLRDYLTLLATEEAFWDVLDTEDWVSLVSGAFEESGDLTTGVYRPSDPAPVAQLLDTEFTDREYYCSC